MKDVSYDACERIVAQAIWAIPGKRIGLLDVDDLRQELTIIALEGARRHDGRDDLGYVRACVRNAVKDLYLNTLTAKRHPQDEYGRPVPFANPEALDEQADERVSPEMGVAVDERLRMLEERLPAEQFAWIRSCLDGREEDSARVVSRIRYICKMADYEIPKPKEVQFCHTLGEDPEGYNAEEEMCQDCLDKFTCLPAAVAKPEVWREGEFPEWEVSEDIEVDGVLQKRITYSAAVERLRERYSLRVAGQEVPERLCVRRSQGATLPPPDRGPVKRKRVRKPKSELKPEPKPIPKVKKRPTRKKKPAVRKKTPPPPRRSRKVVRRPKKERPPDAPPRRDVGIPGPKTLTPDEMKKAMGRVKLGVPLRFRVGLQIVRDYDGEEHVVTLAKHGFAYKGELYPSLSAVAQNITGTPCRSGNDWFCVSKCAFVEVRNRDGKVIAKKGMRTRG